MNVLVSRQSFVKWVSYFNLLGTFLKNAVKDQESRFLFQPQKFSLVKMVKGTFVSRQLQPVSVPWIVKSLLQF